MNIARTALTTLALASFSSPLLAQGPLQQLRQADMASQSALIFSSLENASMTAGAPTDGSQSARSGDLGVSAVPGSKPVPILSNAPEKARSAPPPSSDRTAPAKSEGLDARDKVSIAMVAGGVALPFILAACGAAAPAIAAAGAIGIVVFIAGILVGGFFRPEPKSTP